jgi:hypothetical protein
MVISSIRSHVATHNWFAVSVDLAIVIIGVFLGTQVTDWNNHRIERQQGQSYRARLADELDFNAHQYRQHIAYYRQVQGHGLATLDALGDQASALGSDFLVDAYQTTQIETTPPKRFIYDEMVSAGLVSLLGPPDVQALASDYYLSLEANETTLGDIPPYRTMLRSVMPFQLQMQIRHRCGDIEVHHRGRRIGARLPERCDIAVDPGLLSTAVSRIRAKPEFEDNLTRYVASLEEKLNALDGMVAETMKLRAKLLNAGNEA